MKTLYAARFARVTENLARQGLTQMIVSDPPTIFYLTGVRIQPGERMLALLLRADGNHRFFVNALFGTPEAGIPVENYSDGEDAPAKLLPWLERDKPLGIDKNWPARFLLRLMELDAAPAYRNASAACDDARAIKDAAEQEAEGLLRNIVGPADPVRGCVARCRHTARATGWWWLPGSHSGWPRKAPCCPSRCRFPADDPRA